MKKMLFHKGLLMLASIMLLFPACQDELLELNIDPNNPTEVPAANLVTQAEYAVNDLLWGLGYNGGWTMLLVQQWSENEYAESSRYTVDGNDFDGEWVTMYASILQELKTAREIIEAQESTLPEVPNQLAIIDILKVHGYHNLTDAFGAAPFSQALNSDEYPLPEYDDQQSIYMSLLSMLDAALTSMDENAGSFSSGDLIYNGDASKWKKLGYSLMMRIAMRMVDVDPGTATTYIQKAEGNMMESNADNGLFVFSSDPNLANPNYINVEINNRDDFCVSDVLVDNLKDMGDPRLEKYAKPNNAGEYVGMPYGLTDGGAFALKPISSRPSDLVRSATAPAVIMDYAEVQFLLAEAYQRGILQGDAASAYAEGVRASMNYWGIDDDAAIDAYIAANPYDAANWKESLGWQKWIAFYMNGPQAWAEWRRLDYPELEVPEAATNDVIPVRFAYPISEQTRNNGSLSQVTDNPNDLSTKMWWDVN